MEEFLSCFDERMCFILALAITTIPILILCAIAKMISDYEWEKRYGDEMKAYKHYNKDGWL